MESELEERFSRIEKAIIALAERPTPAPATPAPSSQVADMLAMFEMQTKLRNQERDSVLGMVQMVKTIAGSVQAGELPTDDAPPAWLGDLIKNLPTLLQLLPQATNQAAPQQPPAVTIKEPITPAPEPKTDEKKEEGFPA